jgi:hypothetical protein
VVEWCRLGGDAWVMNGKQTRSTYSVVASLFALITFLVSLGLVFERLLVLLGQFLPLLTEKLADLACERLAIEDADRVGGLKVNKHDKLTKADARVVAADLVTVLVGKEHVGRQTTLGCVGV